MRYLDICTTGTHSYAVMILAEDKKHEETGGPAQTSADCHRASGSKKRGVAQAEWPDVD
jgi:hypothetical protein